MSSHDSHSNARPLTSVSPPRFSEPEREELKPDGYGDSDSRGQEEERNAGNVTQEAIIPGRNGISASLASPFWSKSVSGKKKDRITGTTPNRKGRQHWEKEHR